MSGDYSQVDYEALEIVPVLPDWRGPEASQGPMPIGLVGAKIVSIGTPRSCPEVEGGGLVIDYLPHGGEKPRRLVLGFTELGMWVEYNSPE